MTTEMHKLCKALVTDALEVYTGQRWVEEEQRTKPINTTPEEREEVYRWVFDVEPAPGHEYPISFEDACKHSENDSARIKILMRRLRDDRERKAA